MNIDMFHVFMKLQVLGDGDSGLVVDVKNGG